MPLQILERNGPSRIRYPEKVKHIRIPALKFKSTVYPSSVGPYISPLHVLRNASYSRLTSRVIITKTHAHNTTQIYNWTGLSSDMSPKYLLLTNCLLLSAVEIVPFKIGTQALKNAHIHVLPTY